VGQAADVANYADVQALWAVGKTEFGSIDIWINNAGITTESANIDALPEDQIQSVVSTNLIGLMYCCKIAISGMLEQGQGKVFNMEGFGSDGLTREGLSVYGATKRAVRYFTKSLVKEYASTDLIICYMSPGIVVTDLLTRHMYDSESEGFQKRKRFLNVIGDHVETVAPFLVTGAIEANKTGDAVRWMTAWQALGRFIKSLFVKRDLFNDPV
jgi:NADP-dependent 3-hydroxy acid dehydrogenase YdfG